MIDNIDNIANSTSKKFILRALIGAVNGAMVGVLGTAIRRSRPQEGSGIDGDAELANKLAERDAPVGLEPIPDPLDVASKLMGVKTRLYQLGAEFPDEDLPGNLGDTIDFMAKREYKEGGAAMKELAKALSIPEADLENARKAMFTADKEWLEENRDELIELSTKLEYTEPEIAFDVLPGRYKARLVAKAIAAIERQTSFAIQAVLRGRLAAASDITLNRAVIADINEYVKRQAKEDAEFADAIAA